MNIKPQKGIYKREVEITATHIILHYKKPHVPKLTKRFLEDTSNIPYIPTMQVIGNTIKREIVQGGALHKIPINTYRNEIKRQIIEFIVLLNNAQWAHRDFHCKNIIWNNDRITVIDWEFVCPNPVGLIHCYDLTGHTLESPLNSMRMHVFSKHKTSVKSLFPDITLGDFVKCQKRKMLL